MKIYIVLLFSILSCSLFQSQQTEKENINNNNDNTSKNMTEQEINDKNTILPYITTEETTIKISDSDLYQQSIDDKSLEDASNNHTNTVIDSVPHISPSQYPVRIKIYIIGSICTTTDKKKRN